MPSATGPSRAVFLFWLSLGQLVSWGSTLYLFGLLVGPVEQALQVSRGESSLAFGLAMITEGLMAYPVGRWIDQGHGRRVMTGGSILAGLCLLAMSQAQSLIGFYAAWLVLGAAWACILYTPVFSIVTRRFPQDFRRAIIVLTFLGGLASTVFIPLIAALMAWLGWSATVMIMAALHLGLCAPMHWLLLRHEPPGRHASPAPGGQPAPPSPPLTASQRAVMILIGLFTALGMAMASAIAAHLVPLLRERHMAEFWVIWIPAAIGAIQVFGRALLMWGDGRFDPHRVNHFIVWLSPLSMLVLILAGASTPLLLGFACLWGIANGCQTIVKGTAVAQYVSRDNVAALNGALGIPTAIARMLTPWAIGLIWSPQIGYDHAVWLLLGLSCASALSFGLAQRLSLRQAGSTLHSR